MTDTQFIPWGSFYVWLPIEDAPKDSGRTYLGYLPEALFGAQFEEVVWAVPVINWKDGLWTSNDACNYAWTIKRLAVEAPGLTHLTTLDPPSSSSEQSD